MIWGGGGGEKIILKAFTLATIKRCAIVLQGAFANEIISIFGRIIVLSSLAEEEEMEEEKDRIRVYEEGHAAGPAPEEERRDGDMFYYYNYYS